MHGSSEALPLDDITAAIEAIRAHLAHRYFATLPEIIQGTVDNDLAPLEAAVDRMRSQLVPHEDTAPDKAD